MRRVWETLMYREEADMLAMHLEETPGVSGYVIAEAPFTHRGQFKLPYFTQRDHELFDDPRLHVTVAAIPHSALSSPWTIEHIQRDAALGKLLELGAALDDIVIITDVDKIPSPEVTGWRGWPCAAVRMRTTLFAVDWEVPQEKIPPQAVVCTLRWLLGPGKRSLSYAMDNRFSMPQILGGGWHFSWLGGPEAQADKLDTGTCHTEILGTPEETMIRDGRRYTAGADGGSVPVAPVAVNGDWPAMIRERRCPGIWFRPFTRGLDLSETSVYDAQQEGWPPGGKAAWDVGANVGQNLGLLTSLYTKVIAFEPATESAGKLAKDWSSQVQVVAVAACAVDGEVELAVREEPMASGQLTAVGLPWWGEETARRTVPCITLDSAAAEYGIPDFVKIDTEGHELEVLKGASGLIGRKQTTWMVEFHSKELHEGCAAIFSAAGYKVQTERRFGYAEGSDEWHRHGYLRVTPEEAS